MCIVWCCWKKLRRSDAMSLSSRSAGRHASHVFFTSSLAFTSYLQRLFVYFHTWTSQNPAIKSFDSWQMAGFSKLMRLGLRAPMTPLVRMLRHASRTTKLPISVHSHQSDAQATTLAYTGRQIGRECRDLLKLPCRVTECQEPGSRIILLYDCEPFDFITVPRTCRLLTKT